jgi:hypothetical protein
MGKKTIEKVNPANVWESAAKIYEFIACAHGPVNLSNHLAIMIVYKKIEPISQMD